MIATESLSFCTGYPAIDSPLNCAGASTGRNARSRFAELDPTGTALPSEMTVESDCVPDVGFQVDCDCSVLWQPARRADVNAMRTTRQQSFMDIPISFSESVCVMEESRSPRTETDQSRSRLRRRRPGRSHQRRRDVLWAGRSDLRTSRCAIAERSAAVLPRQAIRFHPANLDESRR